MNNYFPLLVLVLSTNLICIKSDISKAKNNSTELMNALSDLERVKGSFPEPKFSLDQVEQISFAMKQNCDYENRKGKYVDYFYSKWIGSENQVSFIYEYF